VRNSGPEPDPLGFSYPLRSSVVSKDDSIDPIPSQIS